MSDKQIKTRGYCRECDKVTDMIFHSSAHPIDWDVDRYVCQECYQEYITVAEE